VHFHTPNGVRSSVLALAAFGVVASGVLIATPASAAEIAPITNSAAVASTSVASTSVAATAVLRDSDSFLKANTSTVMVGNPAVLTATVKYDKTKALAKRQILLQEHRGSAWNVVAKATLSSTGTAKFTVRPRKATEYRLKFAGVANIGPSWSGPVLVKTRGSTSVERAAKALAVAKSRTGKWYRWGAAGPNNFDCSGLTLYAYRAVGVNLPHSANAQKNYGKAISRSQARPGDLIIFLSGGYGYHAAIYAGGNYMYDAPHAGATVGKHRIFSSNIVFRRLV